ncbi:MAG TPA: serine/threonine-protein kinase [Polyangiales bacterium]|nr:serine/threonine-protein kinase [Polyangiales bacterium]
MRHGKIGRYELLHKIAAGGMAEVFLARQWGQGGFFRDVVIKRLYPHYAEHEHALRMFQDEARLLAELSHPNIPQVYDLGNADGYWYLAMEHVGGVTLTDLCRTAAKLNRPMPLAVAIGIVTQICMALHHAHERRDREGRALKVVHRDVTPHNIVISPDAVVKVLDFGVAQTAARADTDAGAVRGTYAYMSPEQVRGKPLDKRSDVFAVGVILYELTTGRRLFRGSDIEIMTAIVERDVMPPSRHVPNYPVELEQIVLHALQRDRSKRTVSAAHIAIALEQFYMRQGLSSGALVVSHYVRSIFPYERAHEKGMGIVQEPSTVRQTQQPAPAQADDLEAKLFADELRALGQKPATASSEPPEIISVPADMVLEEESAVQPAEAEGGAERRPDRLGLDAFDEDQSVRPVVLLSRKRKPSEQLSDGAFMSDLERRLEAEPGPTDERQTASGGSPDPVRSS